MAPMTDKEWLDHLSRAGRKGGSVRSEAQVRSAKINLYRGLAKRWPNSPSIQQKLRQLEQESK